MKEKKIVWVSHHLDLTPTANNIENRDEINDFDIDEDEPLEELTVNQNMVNTPFGMFKVNNMTNMETELQFWTAHTNFTITEDHLYQLNGVDGLVFIRVKNKHEFIIKIGKLFQFQEVRQSIERILDVSNFNDDYIIEQCPKNVQDRIKSLYQDIKDLDGWIIYVLPNGSVDFTYANESGFQEKYEAFKEGKETYGGLIIEESTIKNIT